MKIFEIAVLLIGAWLAGRSHFGKPATRPAILVTSALAILFVCLHLWVNGYRWQMVPSYVLTAYGLNRQLLSLRHQRGLSFRSRRRRRTLTVTAAISFIFSLLIALALPTMLPVFTFDAPAGQYAVGTREYHMVDRNRLETLTDTPRDYRELLVQVWYPAEKPSSSSEKAPYVKNLKVIAAEAKANFKVPKFLFSYLELVKTNSYPNAQVSTDKAVYPVVLFSHGLPGTRFSNTFQFEQLASYGFIVASIEHTYNAIATVMPDGEFITISNLPDMTDLNAWDNIISEIWVRDAHFVLDQLEELNLGNTDDPLTGRLDLENVGMFGHSFGGANATQALYTDPRIKAAMNMDGTLFGTTHRPEGTGKPYMLMNTSPFVIEDHTPVPSSDQLRELGMTKEQFDRMSTELPLRMKQALATGSYEVTLHQGRHMSFSDYYYWSPALPIMDGLPLSPKRAHEVINAYTVAFFQQHLQGIHSPLLNLSESADYPEAALKRY